MSFNYLYVVLDFPVAEPDWQFCDVVGRWLGYSSSSQPFSLRKEENEEESISCFLWVDKLPLKDGRTL